MVVTLMIAILAAIAIPSYGSYKIQAVDKKMVSVLRYAQEAMEAYFADHATYAAATTTELENKYGFRNTDGVDLDLEVEPLNATSFKIRACAQGGSTQSYVYDSAINVTLPDGSGCS